MEGWAISGGKIFGVFLGREIWCGVSRYRFTFGAVQGRLFVLARVGFDEFPARGELVHQCGRYECEEQHGHCCYWVPLCFDFPGSYAPESL